MAPVDSRHAAWRSEFESIGEESVRMMDSGSQALLSDKIRFSRVWLAERAESKRDAREEETLSIARRALSIAEEANSIATRDLSAAREQARWAKWAAIIAAIAAVIAAKDQILALIFQHS